VESLNVDGYPLDGRSEGSLYSAADHFRQVLAHFSKADTVLDNQVYVNVHAAVSKAHVDAALQVVPPKEHAQPLLNVSRRYPDDARATCHGFGYHGGGRAAAHHDPTRLPLIPHQWPRRGSLM
jgi:hypothetical protein